ncbi:bifunctional Delta(1)-pyrroline-2-carboxylate/Delta(1)-piperideine-2-carboxylate reductase [Paraburkholderia dilworthii]|uniref:ornithine cyclodeaminase family protein n=1 Tax=Paraburkholderia dilworthii TaxID=948106 RepID=UPI000404D52D|nr:ornithine cyclodeaminase family protein [Paraburkholderia dilworthii]
MKIHDAPTTRRALPFDKLIAALEAMFSSGCEVPLRHTHQIDVAQQAPGTVLIMPAWQSGGFLGIKTVNIFAGNASRGLPGLFSTYVLYDANTGEPLAQIDGNEITSRRTAAASALAARHLAREDASRLLVIGSGRVAQLLLHAYRAVRPIRQVTVWSRRAQTAEALAQQWRDEGFDALATTDLPGATANADIVTCATLATEPVVRGEWLRAGTHLDLIGGFMPSMREADDACFEGSDLYIDTSEALKKSGDLLGPLSRGVFTADDVKGTLEALCRGEAPRRRDAAQRTVFKSVGSAIEDLAAAILVHRQAT